LRQEKALTLQKNREEQKMKRVKLDKIDKKILSDLQKNGRMTNVELSDNAGISAPPCLRRVRALEEAGFIHGYHAHLDAHKMGYGVTVFAQVGLSKQNDNDLRVFEQKIQEWDNVRECHMLAGDADFLLKIVAKDWDEYQQFVTGQLTTMSNVESVKSSLTIKMSKYQPGVPVDSE
jgi:DNA-binding Lrp family transcriptional regulator